MKQIRKFLASMLSVLIVISAMPFTAMAADEDIFAVNDYCEWSYTASSGTLYINADGALVAPDKGNHGTYKGGYLPLFKEDGSLFNVRKVTKLIFGKDITQIDDISLSANTKLSYGLQFYNLESIEFEEGSQLSSLPDYFCYDGIGMLSEVCFPETLESLGNYSFYRCTALTEIDLSNTKLSKVNDYAFYGCTGIERLLLPAHNITIGSYAFYCCTNITELVNAQYITTVSIYGMYHCTGLGDTDLRGLRSADTSAFEGDETLTAELINITAAGKNAFKSTGITSLDCTNSSILSLGVNAFGYCKKLETVKLPTSPNFTSIGSYAFNCSSVSNVEIHDNVTSIGEFAFYNTKITSFDMPSNITSLGQYALAACTNLEYIELPESLKTIGQAAFMSSGIKNADVKCVNVNLTNSTQWANIGLCYSVSGSVIRDYTASDILKEYCQKNAITYITVNEEDENIAFSTSGTCENGNWMVYNDEINHIGNILTINVNGKLIDNSFVSEDGSIMTGVELAKKYSVMAIEFSEGITEIGDDIFKPEIGSHLTYQYGLVLPSTLKTVGNNTFSSSTLTNFIIPDTLESIGTYSFAYSFLYSLTLGNGLTEIPEGAFYGTRATEINIPENVKKLGKKSFGAFEENEYYAKERIVKIPATVTEIYYDLDNPADNAVGFTADGEVDEKVTLYVVYGSAGYDYAVKTGANYELYVIDTSGYACNYDGDDYIENYESMKWTYDTDSKTLTITGDGVFNADTLYYNDGTKVGKYDFPVDKIVFDEGITGLDLKYAYVSTSNHTYMSILTTFNPSDIELPSTLKSIGNDIFYNCSNLKSVIIPNSVTSISLAFENCSSLEAISFGKGLKSIPKNAFKNLKSLRFVDFGGVEEIGASAFKNCSHLEEIVLPDSVTTVGNDAFYGCVSVLSIDIGSSLKSVGTRAFANMPLCERVVTNSSVFNDGVVKGINVFNNTGCSTSGVTIVFDDVETADFLPYADMKITGIELGSNVCAIKNQQYLTSLKEISVNNDNTDYYSDNNYLYSSDNILALVPMTLETVKIPDGTTSIGDYACYGTNASGITLPDSITSIGKYAFAGSTSLKSISINEGTKTIGDNAFENCVSLKLLALPDFVESIGTRAFAGCTNIASIIFDYDLLTIGTEAFEGCTSLAGIVFPEQLDTIGDRAFMNCTGLEYAYIWYSQLGEDVFKNDDLLTIYTMVGSDAYRYAREYDTQYSAYTDEDAFYDEWAVKLDVLAGYLGYCSDGHGDIQYLTVYEADCENDGYIIGVCEYCSEILDEIHIDAYNHSYVLTADIPATETTKGMKVYTCENCGSSYAEYTPPASEDFEIETHTVKGSVVIATNNTATAGKTPLKNVSIVIDGYTMATTDADGKFSFKLDTGVYEAQLKYAYGFTRTIYIVVEDEDIEYDTPIPIIGCDFNKDGIIDNDDLTLFQYVVSSKANDPSYLEFVDMNNDGYINAKDRAYIISCKGLKASEMKYPEIIIQK